MEEAKGITLRDWFAGMALQGILSRPITEALASSSFASTALEEHTRAAYAWADAMLKARALPAKPPPGPRG